MKTESLKELDQAVTILTDTPTDLSHAKEDILKAIEHIKAAVFMETPTPKGTFNLYNYVGCDKYRPTMNGVYHDGGFMVATDSHVLVAIKSDYDKENEGKSIGKDGVVIVGKYPTWRVAVPEDNLHAHTVHTIDTAKVYELVKRVKAENKLAGRDGVKKMGIVKVGDTFFNAEKFAQMSRFLDHYGIKEVNTFGERLPTKAVAPDGSICILMPVMIYAKRWENEEPDYLGLEFA